MTIHLRTNYYHRNLIVASPESMLSLLQEEAKLLRARDKAGRLSVRVLFRVYGLCRVQGAAARDFGMSVPRSEVSS